MAACVSSTARRNMILVSGFNVYPNEIENIIAAHPGYWKSR